MTFAMGNSSELGRRRRGAPISRRGFLAAALALGAGCSGAEPRPPYSGGDLTDHEAGLRKAARYLWSQQDDDGGWHSSRYGLLRSGQSLTPFVLDALLRVPAKLHAPRDEQRTKALAFLTRHTDDGGAVGRIDPALLDYPNYATALTLQVLLRMPMPYRLINIQPMTGYLIGQQFSEQNGWSREHPAYGGWGMGGDVRTYPHAGHVDISMTRYVLQALAATGFPPDSPIFERARVFVERCQNYDPERPDLLDGSFFFSPVVVEKNKAGSEGERYRGYGTTTADGILCLRAIGAAPSEPRLQAALEWLKVHHRSDQAPGFEEQPHKRWAQGLRYYYAAASSEVFGGAGRLQGQSLGQAMIELQRRDGSWANPEDIVKEDDPLIATPLAVRTLLHEMETGDDEQTGGKPGERMMS